MNHLIIFDGEKEKKSTFRDDASSLSSHEDPNILLKIIPTKIKNDNTLNILKQVKKERYYIQLRCEQIVEKIKKHKMEYIFHSSSSLDSFISNNKVIIVFFIDNFLIYN